MNVFGQIKNKVEIYKTTVDTLFLANIENSDTTYTYLNIYPIMITIDDNQIIVENVNVTTIYYIISKEVVSNNNYRSVDFYKTRDEKQVRSNVYVLNGNMIKIYYNNIIYLFKVKKIN